MIAYWQNLNERERALVLLGGIFCGIYLLYLLIISPINNAIKNRNELLTEKIEIYNWLYAKEQNVAKPNFTKITNTKLLSILSAKLKVTNLQNFPFHLEQTSGGLVQLNFDKVPFTEFMKFLWLLSQKYAFSVKELRADRLPTEGLVKLTVTLEAR